MRDDDSKKLFHKLPWKSLDRLHALRDSQSEEERAQWSVAAAGTVLLAIAEHMNKKGEAWPSAGRLGALCRMGRATVFRQLGALQDARILFATPCAGFATIFRFDSNPAVGPRRRLRCLRR